MSDPAPTEVRPTMKPPTAPIATVAPLRTTMACVFAVGAMRVRPSMANAPMMSAVPSKICRRCSATTLSPKRCMTYVPKKAAGSEP